MAAILAVGTLISGCNRDAHAPAAKAKTVPAVIRLLVVDEPSLVAAIQGIAGDWKAQSDSPLQVSAISAEEAARAEKLDADAVIFPPELLGTFAERRLIRPLNRVWLSSDLLAADDLLTPLDSPELCWDGQPMAIPLGEPVLLAFYRTDVLERLGKTPPKTWDEYQQLVDQVGREHQLRPTAEPLAGGWAAQLLLARAAAYARHRDYLSVLFNRETMEPLIAGSPFVRALEELVKTAKLNPAGTAALTPQQCVDLVLNGKAAMAIGVLDRHTKSLPTRPIAVAELPGSDTAYHWGQSRWEPRRVDETGRVTLRGLGGCIGAVVRGSDHAESAFLLLSWLASKHGSEELMSADIDFQPFRLSQLAAPQHWLSESVDPALAKTYAEVLSSALRRKEVLWMLQIPGANEYMAALDQAVRAAVSGEKTSQQALDAAAEQWKQITARYGVQKQRDAYRRSLKLLE